VVRERERERGRGRERKRVCVCVCVYVCLWFVVCRDCPAEHNSVWSLFFFGWTQHLLKFKTNIHPLFDRTPHNLEPAAAGGEGNVESGKI